MRVRFSGFGTSALEISVRVFALTNDWNEYHAIREDLYLRFAEVIEQSGTSITFPSTTMYLGRDAGLDPDKVEESERKVNAWRKAGGLPFPRMPRSRADQITDTLDYPPEGSPEAEHKATVEQPEELLAAGEIAEDKVNDAGRDS